MGILVCTKSTRSTPTAQVHYLAETKTGLMEMCIIRRMLKSLNKIQNSRHPQNAAKMTLLQCYVILKPAFVTSLHFTSTQMNWTERVNSDSHLFVQTKNTQAGRYLYPLSKSQQGQMIKKKKNCTVLLNNSWNTGFLANAVLCETCVCVFFVCALTKLMPWLSKVWVLLLWI